MGLPQLHFWSILSFKSFAKLLSFFWERKSKRIEIIFFHKILSKICSHKYQPVLSKKITVKALPNLKLPKHMKKRFIKKLVISMAKLTEWIWMNSKWLAKVPTLIVMDVRIYFHTVSLMSWEIPQIQSSLSWILCCRPF